MSDTIVYSGNAARADFVKSFLDSNGISAWLVDSTLGTIAPHYVSGGGTGAVKVAVPPEEAEQAKQLLEELESQPDSPTWTCPKCGEKIEGQFSQCWKCGASRQ